MQRLDLEPGDDIVGADPATVDRIAAVSRRQRALPTPPWVDRLDTTGLGPDEVVDRITQLIPLPSR